MLCTVEVLAIGTEKISGEGKYLVHAGEEQRGRKRRKIFGEGKYESFSDLGEIRVWLRADFQSGSRVLKKVF